MQDKVPQSPDISLAPQTPAAEQHVIHTYQSDLELAMDTTEASAVQALLQTARTKEADEIEKGTVHRERRWYTAASTILIIIALAAGVYGVYYYRHLTVGVAPSPSVGVFQSIDPIIATAIDVPATIARIKLNDTLPEGKPVTVPILADETTRTPFATEALLDFVGFHASEPFLATISLARLGAMNVGKGITTFLLFSTPTPELASKEFLIAEPKLLDMAAPVLGIDLTSQTRDIGTSFTSAYMYNLPIRTLTATDIDTKEKTILMYYGYATDRTIVVATDPTVLKAIYDTIIRQR